jgi:putative ABC transport system permease protein
MWRLTLSNALAHRSRLALTWLAVALGVAFVAGSLVLTDTSSRLLDEQFRTSVAGVDLTVRTAAAFDAAMGLEVQRDPLPTDLPDRIAATPGVGQVRAVAGGAGQLQVRGQVVKPNGPTLIGSWAQRPYAAYALRAGRAPSGVGEVVIDARTAAAQRIALGDTVTVSATTSRQLQVVGLAGVGDADGIANTAVVLTDLPTAQTLLGLGSRISSVDVIAEDGASGPDLRSRVAASLGSRYAVSSTQDASAASADAAKESIKYLRIALLALAAAGLVVGAFLIANTFGIVLTQRSRELALLRAAGATGRQVFASVFGEALLVGLAGAVGGTVLGIGAAYGQRGLAQGAGLALPDGPLTITVRTLVVAVGAGTLVTLVAALAPARRAAQVAPVEAMRASDPASRTPRRGRVLAGWILLGLAVAGLVVATIVREVVLVGSGAAVLLAALVVLGPVVAPRLARTVGRPLLHAGVPGQLARQSTVRNPRRTASTAMALALSLALISFVAVLGDSVKAISAGGTEAVTAELMVQSTGNEMLGGLSPEVAQRVSALPEVGAVSAVRYGHWLDKGVTSALTAADPASLAEVVKITPSAGNLTALAHGGVVVAEDVATQRHLQVGDTLAMTFPRDGEQPLRIVGLMDDKTVQALSTNYLISTDTYSEHYAENVDATVYVALADGVDPTEARSALNAAVSAFPNAQVRDQAEAAAGRVAAVEQVLGLITVLLGFAVLIALLGITNTLALSIVERTREIGLLRAVGMTRVQLRWMVRAEAVLVAAVAVVIGVLLGVGLGIATLAGLSAGTELVVSVPAGQLVATVVLAVLAGLAAGLLPARRAARLDVLDAIAAQ